METDTNILCLNRYFKQFFSLPALLAKKVYGLLFIRKGLIRSQNNKIGLESFAVL